MRQRCYKIFTFRARGSPPDIFDFVIPAFAGMTRETGLLSNLSGDEGRVVKPFRSKHYSKQK
jgi:hypothetical protein